MYKLVIAELKAMREVVHQSRTHTTHGLNDSPLSGAVGVIGFCIML